jgi:hypothetical protein
MFAGKMVGEVRTFAGGEQVFFVTLGLHLVGLVALHLSGRFVLIALQISHAARAPDFVAALACEVVELLPDVPK